MVSDNTCKVMLTYQDKDKRQSRIMFRLPFSTSASDAFAWGFGMASHINSLSDAVLVQVQVSWSFRNPDAPPAGLASDVHRKLALFYRNEQYYEAIWIPSPSLALFESEGKYAGIRLDPLNPSVLAWTTNPVSLLQNVITEDMASFPTHFVVGGLML